MTAGCVGTLLIHSVLFTAFIPTLGIAALLAAPVLAWTLRGITPNRSRKAFLKESDVRLLEAAKEPLLLKAREEVDNSN